VDETLPNCNRTKKSSCTLCRKLHLGCELNGRQLRYPKSAKNKGKGKLVLPLSNDVFQQEEEASLRQEVVSLEKLLADQSREIKELRVSMASKFQELQEYVAAQLASLRNYSE
jgi:hypothetical protein